jgi:hypothetical protein
VSAPNDPRGPSDDESTQANVDRQPYEKPAFFREQVFETMALSCGKSNPSTGQCKTVKKNS